jgi:membrane fusion protein, multidrug efflux system
MSKLEPKSAESRASFNRLPFFIILSLLISLIVYLQWPSSDVVKTKQTRIFSVKTAQVSLAKYKDVVEALGTAVANEQVQITTKYSNLIASIYFQDGQQVNKGDTLVQLDDQEEAAKVKELSANLEEAQVQLRRFQNLLKKRATSKSQLDQQQAKTKVIAAQILNARSKLEALTIKAPFTGVLGFRQVSVGSFVVSGDVITTLDDLSRIKIDFSVPERFLTTLALGQNVNVTSVAYDNKTFHGKITSVAARIDPITRMVALRAEIINSDNELRPGMLLNVAVVRQINDILQIPESAIVPIEDKHYVFVIQNNVAKKQAINIGRRQPGFVEVVAGLNKMQQVVVEGALKLHDGSIVKVLEE